MAAMTSYDQKGKKLSFADWISNLSPEDTPFLSLIGKESIDQTSFSWQTDVLALPVENAKLEGENATEDTLTPTSVFTNVTQILRKTVKVSDTASATANYGRGNELAYQMAKKGKEIKRDLEHALLTQKAAVNPTSAATARKFAGYQGLIGVDNTGAAAATDSNTGATVVIKSGAAGTFDEDKLFELTYNLYLAGSKANIIMFHPKHAKVFSDLMEKHGKTGEAGATRVRAFGNDSAIKLYVSTVVDPLGQEFKLIPNRWMPEDAIYVFSPEDFTQMVFRASALHDLAKLGSAETKMIEMEVSLRARHPYCAGVLSLVA